jgi:hypothetical protein
MSIGSYVLTGFGAASALTAVADWLGWRRVARAAQIPAAVAGAGLCTNTAALLSSTRTPRWAAEPRRLGGRFASSAMASGAAALALAERLDGEPANARTLDRLALAATAAELALAGVSGRRLRGPELAVLALGAGLPLAGYGLNLVRQRRSPGLSIAASLAVLAGGMLMRQAVLRAGQRSAERPREYFRLTQGVPR